MAFEVPGVAEKPVIPNRIGLIDADCVAYWAAAGCDEMLVQAAYKRCDDRMEAISDQIQTKELRLYLTGKHNFREEVAEQQRYKGNRYDKYGNRITKQPLHLQAVRKYLIDKHDAVLCDGQEADDALAIAQVKCNASSDWHSIISSIDKDLRIIPGLHHDMNSGYIEEIDTFGYLSVDKKNKVRGAGLKFFCAQLLMGDSADWIPGLPKVTKFMKEKYDGVKRLGGCGPKAAYGVLDGAGDYAEALFRVLESYASYWDGEHFYEHWDTGERIYPDPVQALEEQGRLLWMRRKDGDRFQLPRDIVVDWHKRSEVLNADEE